MPANLFSTSPTREAAYGVLPSASPIQPGGSGSAQIVNGNGGTYNINATTALTMTLQPPAAIGVEKTIWKSATGADQTVLASGCTIGSAMTTLTFFAIDQVVTLFGAAADKWVIKGNYGSAAAGAS